ncbi:peroxisomal sarcosine oxidase isoform X2 [Epinephelus moara]|uniref:peroxisomal sarcosine oxidase isoform X2 n=1 Tax=Epinephelus moara TaxID=300413 RepID=UPI00214E3B86|nr:peroxisomal sarcosine oxidase isoform X2 [Epinephelus moara]
MSTKGEYDCIVIGAGVQGSFTAYQLAKKNQRTLLLEQFVLPHTRGSSHGQTRIIRKAYEQDFYTHMMEECYELWTQLEREAGVKLYRQTGLLVMGPERSQSYQMVKNTLQRNKVPMMILSSDNFSQHIPHVILAEGDEAVVDITAGVLYADRALKAVQGQFQKLGGVIRDKEKVMDIKPGPVVTVSTSNGVYRAKRVVITAGPWANQLLAHTGLQLPLEICYHMGSETDPDQRDKQTDRSDIDILQRYIARCLPGLVPEPAVVESCLYTLTPDRHFVLDCHPTYSNIVFGAGFSGHGFKFGPIIGKLLCELTLGEVPSYDLSPFRIRRFQAMTKSAL